MKTNVLKIYEKKEAIFVLDNNDKKFYEDNDPSIVLENNKCLKFFISRIIKECENIKENTNGEIDSIFILKNKNNTNEYLVLDHRFLLEPLAGVLDDIGISKKKNDEFLSQFNYMKDKENRYEMTKRIIMRLAIKDVAYLPSKISYFFSKYNMIKDNSLIRIQGIALNKNTIYEMFSDDDLFKSRLDKIFTKEYVKTDESELSVDLKDNNIEDYLANVSCK